LSDVCEILAGVHQLMTRQLARRLFGAGVSKAQIARELGVNRSTVRVWCTTVLPTDAVTERCPRCRLTPELPADLTGYAYLLGQYLGDGHLAIGGGRVPTLRIACTAAYPAIMDEVEHAMRGLLAKSVFRVAQPGCFHVKSYSKHWPCLFPQAGAGPKHLRPIVLVPWQQEIVDAEPRALLRGLIHSDGYRGVNGVTVRGKDYQYVRYLFSNESTDILKICGDALDRIGAQWRYNRPNSISVAKRDSVALLDTFIGPKC